MRIYILFTCLIAATPLYAQTCNSSMPASTNYGQFIINATNNTVLDEHTNLMWKRCLEGQSNNNSCSGNASSKTWEKALQDVQDKNDTSVGFAGFNDWRVPNIKELATITEVQCAGPAVNLAVFPNVTSSHNLWSSSPSRERLLTYSHHTINTGILSGEKKRDETNFVRLVRTP